MVVVAEAIEVALRKGRTTEELRLLSAGTRKDGMHISTYSKRSGRVTCRGPLPAPVKSETLVSYDPHDTTSAEGLWVGLTLDLEHIEWEEHNLSDTDHTARTWSATLHQYEAVQTYLPAKEDIIALPVLGPNVRSKSVP